MADGVPSYATGDFAGVMLDTTRVASLFRTRQALFVSKAPMQSRRRQAVARISQPSLLEFLILSMLLHLLVIVLFGNPSGGSLRRGEESSSPLDVRLRRPTAEPGAGFRLAPGAETTERGSALLPRPGAASQPSTGGPGAAERAPVPPAPGLKGERSEVPAAAPEAAGRPQEALPRAPSTSREAPPGLNLEAPQEVDRTFVPKPKQRLTPRDFQGRLAAPAELAPLEVPVPPSAPLQRIAPSQAERRLAQPLELAPRELPVAPPEPIERMVPPRFEPQIGSPAQLMPRELPAPAAPVERLEPSRAEQQLAPPVELKPLEPIFPAARLEQMAPATSERTLSSPTELQSSEPPTAPGAPIERLAPPTAAPAQRVAPPAELQAPVPSERELAPAGRVAPGAESEPAPAPRGGRAPQVEGAPPSATSPERAPAATPERFHFGSPTPEEEIFKPRGNVMPPLEESSMPPYIDLEGARREATRQVAREGTGSRAILALPLEPPPEYKSKEARALEKAVKPDCRTAYAALGLFAVPALLVSAFTDTGCRW